MHNLECIIQNEKTPDDSVHPVSFGLSQIQSNESRILKAVIQMIPVLFIGFKSMQ